MKDDPRIRILRRLFDLAEAAEKLLEDDPVRREHLQDLITNLLHLILPPIMEQYFPTPPTDNNDDASKDPTDGTARS